MRVVRPKRARSAMLHLHPLSCVRLYALYPRPARARVRCSLCPLRVCMCVYDTYADNTSKAQMRRSKPQNHDSAPLGFLSTEGPNTYSFGAHRVLTFYTFFWPLPSPIRGVLALLVAVSRRGVVSRACARENGETGCHCMRILYSPGKYQSVSHWKHTHARHGGTTSYPTSLLLYICA
jgi:hypothetical protein